MNNELKTMNKRRTPVIIIISAPSGSGKTTLIKQLTEKMPDVARSISYTTREPREEERDKDDYIFISQEEFKRKIKDGDLLEWEEKFGNYYGTPRETIEEAARQGQDIVLSLDIKGARTIKQKFPESISIFIMPPSDEELAIRLKKRDSGQLEEVSKRLKEAQKEISASDEYDYLIINETIEKASEELKTIIQNERANRKR